MDCKSTACCFLPAYALGSSAMVAGAKRTHDHYRKVYGTKRYAALTDSIARRRHRARTSNGRWKRLPQSR
jgi:hypothetical protein